MPDFTTYGSQQTHVYRVMYRNARGQTVLTAPRLLSLSEARRLVERAYPRTGTIHTERDLIT